MTRDAPQREHDLREVFNGMRRVVHAGSPPACSTRWRRTFGGSCGCSMGRREEPPPLYLHLFGAKSV
jgi:hypothetical protein